MAFSRIFQLMQQLDFQNVTRIILNAIKLAIG